MPMTEETRWLVSCHEAGHAVVACVFGGRCEGAIITAAGGLTSVHDLVGDGCAYMVAAGDAAEVLSEEHDAPTEAYRTAEAIAAGDVPTAIKGYMSAVCTVADIPQVQERYPSDAMALAQWAVDGREEQPESWARRVAFARHVAQRAVEANRDRILAIARRLYVEGVVSGQEIEELAKK